jgi:hypothetical protein
MYGYCNNSDEHKREGREDFERRGRYGYDSWKYDDPFNDCNKAYTDGFNEARREEERREERRQEEAAQERREMQQARDRRESREQEENDYWDMIEEQRRYEQQQPQPEQQYPEDDLPF